MMPSTELRIRSMLRAIEQIVLPAIPASNSLAQEQAQLVLGHLQVLLEQTGHEFVVRSLDTQALVELADALVDASVGGEATKTATESLRDLSPDASNADLSFSIERLMLASGLDGSEEFVTTSSALVLAYSRYSNQLNRAWFKGMQFDAEPDSLPSIETLAKVEGRSR